MNNMVIYRSSWIAVITFILTMSGCSSTEVRSGNPLNDTHWGFIGMEGIGMERIEVPSNSNITLNLTESQMSGSAGCNHYSFNYKVAGNNTIAVDASSASATMAACSPPSVMLLENRYLEQLKSASTFQIIGNSLLLRGKGGNLAFQRK